MGADAEQEGPRGRRGPGRAPDGLRADSALGLLRPLPAAARRCWMRSQTAEKGEAPRRGEGPGFRGPTRGGGRGEAARAPLQDSRARAQSGPGGSTPPGGWGDSPPWG